MRGWPKLNSLDPINKGLLAYWTLDGATVNGTSVADVSGGANTGTLTNAPTLVAGMIGQAYSFNGSNQYISVADTAALRLGGNYSVSVRVKPSSLHNFGNIFGKIGTSSLSGWGIITFSDGHWGWQIGGQSDTNSATGALQNGIWSHLVATYDGTTLSLYQNGTLKVTSTRSATTSTTNALTIGTDLQNGRYFTGAIDDVRVASVAWSPADVMRLYTDTPGGLGLVAPRRVLVGAATALISSLTEAATATDTVSGLLAASGAVTEAATATDTVSGLLAASGAVTEAATASDTVSGAFAALASITEAATASDTPTATGAGAVTVLEAAVASDAITSSLAAAVAITEAATAADTASGLFAAAAAVTDATTASDAVSGTFAASASVTDAATATETASGVRGAVASVTDAATGADTMSGTFGALASVTDAAAATDTVSDALGLVVSVAETATATDAPANVLGLSSAVTEAGAATDAATPSLGLLAAITEAAASADTATAAASSTASLADATSATDNATAILAFLASASEGIFAADVVTALNSDSRVTLAEPLAALDTVTAIRRGALARAATSHAIPRHL